MTRGEVWWARLPEPWGRRPVLLLARDEAYNVLTWVTVAPITTNVRAIPTAVRLTPDADGVPRLCAASLDNLQAIHHSWLDERITSLGPDRMHEIERAVHFALDLTF
jgi:mRNA interferase MazF